MLALSGVLFASIFVGARRDAPPFKEGRAAPTKNGGVKNTHAEQDKEPWSGDHGEAISLYLLYQLAGLLPVGQLGRDGWNDRAVKLEDAVLVA